MVRCLFVFAGVGLLAGCSSFGGLDQLSERPAPKMTIGVQTIPITQAIESGVKTGAPSGLYVTRVDPRQPAARGGIQKGDVLLVCGAKPLDDPEDLQTALDALEPGSRVLITVWRGGGERKVLVRPEPAKPAA